MYRRSLASLVAVLSICAVAGGAVSTAVASSGVSSGGRLLKTHAREVLPRHGGAATSLNWGGYAVTPASKDVTGVSSTFVVPKAGLIPPGFAATWTGIGGYTTSDLIQAGVSESSLPTNPITGAQYGAWYEILPASETPITACTGNAACTVSPGDAVAVAISQASPGQWAISIKDPTEGWTWSKTIPYASTESSAEWILEAPTVIAQSILAGTGTTTFGPTSTFTTASHGTQTIAQGDPTAIALSPGLINEATPSALAADGQSFDVCAYKQTCPAP
jgi:hypothetical protein